MFLSSGRLLGIKPTLEYDPFFSSVGLLMHMDGANGSTTITDLIGSTITNAGSPTISTAQFKFGGSSLSLNGSSGLQVADKAGLAPGTGDFTVEMWIRPTATANARLWSYQAAGSAQVLILGRDATGRIFGELRNNTGSNDTTVTGATVLSLNTWYHVAFVRQGTTCYIFVDGVMEGNIGGMTQNIPTGGVCSIGYYQTGNTNFFTGFIEDIRFTKGVARYTASFTPQNRAFPDNGIDPYFSSVYALLHFDGANGATTTTDVKGNTVTVGTPGCQISTTQFKYGGSSMSFTKVANAKVSLPLPAIGTQDFTIEFWVRFNTVAGAGGADSLFDSRPLSQNGPYPDILYQGTGGWTYFVGGTAVISGGSAVANTWYHVAVSRVSGTTRMFVNGAQVGSNQAGLTDYNVATTVNMGASMNNGQGNLDGYLEDVRITIGVGRYSAAFTPWPVAFPNN